VAKRCVEEFNPWPPFVDIFASVILVMLLFMLILLVNLGYYSQFKYKTTSVGSVTDKILQSHVAAKVRTEFTEKNKPQDDPRVAVIQKQVKDEEIEIIVEKRSFFEGAGSKSDGNAIAREKDKDKTYSKQIAALEEGQFVIRFQDKEMFAKRNIINQMLQFLNNEMKIAKIKRVEISVSDPLHISSKTVAKQISLGRVLNIKSKINKFGIEREKIKMNLQGKSELTHKFGFVVIKVVK